MARSQEKAMSMLNRWVDQRRAVESGVVDLGRAPRFPSECRTVKDGEAARAQVARRVGSMIAQIQNPTLGEQRIREMNDDINRLLRLKYAWEMQIRKLGGPDYASLGGRLGEADGVEAPGQSGYKYFGAAKDLPGVRELFEQAPAQDETLRSRKDIMATITPDYYGWTDDVDPMLLEDERAAESVSEQQEEPNHMASGSLPGLSQLPGQRDTKTLERLLLKRKKEILVSTFTQN